MQDFRVDERSYARESKSLNASKKTMVMQERLFFRNIPLSNWIEHEMVVEEGTDLDQLPKESVFQTATITTTTITPPVAAPAEDRLSISKFLDNVTAGNRNRQESKVFAAKSIAAFGAQ
jgi:hypothetical protein